MNVYRGFAFKNPRPEDVGQAALAMDALKRAGYLEKSDKDKDVLDAVYRGIKSCWSKKAKRTKEIADERERKQVMFIDGTLVHHMQKENQKLFEWLLKDNNYICDALAQLYEGMPR